MDHPKIEVKGYLANERFINNRREILIRNYVLPIIYYVENKRLQPFAVARRN
jgi:hypothetical protein